jgi:CTP:phosphocholine cytidylyltransferase-like protein
MKSLNILSQNTTSKHKMNKKKYLTVVKKRNIVTIKKPTDALITFVLLCDMPGYRMKSYGTTSMTDILGKKLIDLQIEAIKEQFKKYEIIICAGFDCENLYKHIRQKYKKDNIRIVENQLFNNCNSCESLRLCLNNLNNGKIFIIDGSLLFRKNIFEPMDLSKSFLMIEKKPSENLEIGLNINENNLVEHISFGAKYTWSEILYICDDRVLECLKKLLSNMEYKNRFIFEILNDTINLKHKFEYLKNNYPIEKINNVKTYKNITR